MASITLCPRCAKPVAVPSIGPSKFSGSETEVRCPLCQAEYRLADAIPGDVPPLEILGGPLAGAAEPNGLAADSTEDMTLSGDLPLGDDLALSDDLALRDELAAAQPEAADDPAQPQALGMTAALEEQLQALSVAQQRSVADLLQEGIALLSERYAHEPAHLVDGDHLEDDPFGEHLGEPGEGVAVAKHAIAEHEADAHPLADEAGIAAVTAAAARRTARRPKRRGPGVFGQMVGIVVFGIIGLGLGYLVLRWIKPEAAKPFDHEIASVWTSVSSLWPSQKSAPGKQNAAPRPGEAVQLHYDNGQIFTNPAAKNAGSGEGHPPLTPPGPGSPADFSQQKGSLPEAKSPTKQSPPTAAGAAASPGPVQKQPGASGPNSAAAAPDLFGPPPGLKFLSLDQFKATLDKAHAAVDKSPGSVNGEVFKAFCDVGYDVTLLFPNSPEAREARHSAADMLRAEATPENRPLIGVYAYLWLFSGHRPADKPGVLLVGRVDKVASLRTPRAELFETQLTIQGKSASRQITVLSVARPDYHVHDTAGILGTIVSDPSTRLPWYTGHDAQVVLSGAAVKLAK